MSAPLSNKCIVITGAFGNLGMVVARVAADRGAKVALVDRAPVPQAKAFDGLPDDVLALGDVDMTNLQQAEKALQTVADRYGRIDALLNIAGGFAWETFADNALDSWDFLYTVNLKTAVTATKAALPRLLDGGGAVVCVSAGAAQKSGLGQGPYAASKAGVSRFVESLSEEVKDQGVRINAVLPSIIDTPDNREGMPDAEFDRWVSPEALANVILFLVSEEASAIHGAQIPVFNRV